MYECKRFVGRVTTEVRQVWDYEGWGLQGQADSDALQKESSKQYETGINQNFHRSQSLDRISLFIYTIRCRKFVECCSGVPLPPFFYLLS